MDLFPSSILGHEVSLFDESGVSLPCVGTIISSYLILTLASCLYGNGNKIGRNKLSIKTKGGNGQNSKLEEEQIRRISRIIFHPNSKNDLAILVFDENLDSSVKILQISGISNESASESTWTNFNGRLCREDSVLSSLQISHSSECPFSSAKSDTFCLLPLDPNETDSSCSRPFPGSSLLCSDEQRGEFLCGILNNSSENVNKESGQIYTNITTHLKWIESVSAEVKAEKFSHLKKLENAKTSFESSAEDYDFDMAASFPDFEDRTRKTRNAEYDVGCGGFINLEREYEIVYKVPEQLRGEKSVCVWVVAAPEASKIETEVLSNPEAQFQPEESTIFAIYNFRSSGFRHGKIMRKDKAFTINQPFLVLYFRTNSTAPNSGVHIRLIGVAKKGTQKVVKYLELTPTLTTDGAAQEFKYPQSPASNYTENERTFIIVKPASRHGKLKLGLESAVTADDGWMEILSVESKPTSHFRFSGGGFWSNQTFEAEESEPFIIYFHSSGFQQESGFQLTYSDETMGSIVTPSPDSPAETTTTTATASITTKTTENPITTKTTENPTTKATESPTKTTENPTKTTKIPTTKTTENPTKATTVVDDYEDSEGIAS